MAERDREKKGKSSQFKKKRRKPCVFCIDDKKLDFKDVSFVRRFMTDRGKIAPRRLSGCCALHQRMIAKAVKRAREVGLVPYMVD